MYKLTVVSGPNRGTSYVIQSGENSIGRQAGNTVVLPSAKVSKRHCVLVVDNENVLVQDQNSSNGTFVNGVLTRARKILPGDRISVGEFVLELIAPPSGALRPAPAVAGFGNVLEFPGAAGARPVPRHAASAAPHAGFDPPGLEMPGGAQAVAPSGPPKDLKGRALWAFENYVMPFFHGLNMKNEWRMVAAGVFGVFLLLNVVASVSPLLESNRVSIVQEVKRRARFMARQIAETNVPAISQRAESKTEIGLAENGEHVRLAVLVDLDNRIIAPSNRMNQYLAAGIEGREAARAAKMFRNGREAGYSVEADGSTVVAIEPVKVASSVAGKNVVAAMAIVSVDSSMATLAMGEIGTVYSKAIIVSGILGALALLILYRLTLKPFQVLNEDMDRALKGDMSQVTHEFKFEELNALWDLINSALQRIPKAGSSSLGGGGGASVSADDFADAFKAIAEVAKSGLLILDSERKIVHLNPLFEEISGIRADGASGQEVSAVARDQAFSAFVNDLCDRAAPGSEGIRETFDFSGISYQVHAVAMGRSGDSAACHALFVTKNAESG